MGINNVEERLRNLEARQSLLMDALLGILQEVKPDHQSSFAIYAFMAGLTAAELEEVEAFFRWAAEKRQRGKLTHEALAKRFEERLPRRKDALRSIAQGYRVEGKFPYVCDFILGEEEH